MVVGSGGDLEIRRLVMSRSVVVGLAVLMLVFGTGIVGGGEVYGDEAALQKENSELKAEVLKLRAKVKALEDQLAERGAEVKKLEDEKTKLAGEKKALVDKQLKADADARAYFVDKAYDAGKDETTITSRLMKVNITHGKKRYHWMTLVGRHAGKSGPGVSGGKVGGVELKLQSYFTGKSYAKMKHIEFVADGVKLMCEVTGYDAKVRVVGSARKRVRRDDEFVTGRFTLDQLKTLAGAKEVRGRMGTNKFVLTPGQLATFNAMGKELGVK